MRLDKPLSIIIPALIVLAVLLALLFPWRCTAQEQVSVAVTLTPDQQAVMQEAHGTDWSVWLHDRLREAARNHLSAARETMIRRTAARLRSAAVTPEEAVTVNRILDSARVREERRQAAEEMERRRIDSVAAEKKIGVLLRETDQPQLAGLGIGKMLSTRLALLEGFEETKPAAAPPSGSFANEDAFITYVYVVHILAVIGLISLGYWVYTAAA